MEPGAISWVIGLLCGGGIGYTVGMILAAIIAAAAEDNDHGSV